MTKKKPKSPFENFTEAAKKIFNLPQGDVKKIQAAVPVPKQSKPKTKGKKP